MKPQAFFGGALVGAAGLAAAAFIDHKITEAKFSPKLKQPDALDNEQVVRELNNYFFKIQALYSKCNKIALENSDLIVTSVTFPWDNPLRKVANILGDKLARVCRHTNLNQLADIRREANDIYRRYLGIFERANAIFAERGQTQQKIKANLFASRMNVQPTSSSGDDWDTSFESEVDYIRDTLEASCDMAEHLIERLEQSPARAALDSCNK